MTKIIIYVERLRLISYSKQVQNLSRSVVNRKPKPQSDGNLDLGQTMPNVQNVQSDSTEKIGLY